MKSSRVPLHLALVAAAALALGGCGETTDHSKAAVGEDHDHGGGHAHTAKYGGRLVELGDHEANLEFVLDGPGGKLTAYVLDAHAENFVRLPVTSFTVVAKAGGAEQTLTFQPVGNSATGEKVGDTSQFEATADWLKSTPSFTATVVELPVKSKTYRNVQFSLPK